MTTTLVATDFHLATDISGYFTTKVTFDLVVRNNVVTHGDQLVVSEFVNAGIGIYAGSGECFDGAGASHSEDIGKSDFRLIAALINLSSRRRGSWGQPLLLWSSTLILMGSRLARREAESRVC